MKPKVTMGSMPENYTRVMYIKFDDGEIMYHKPFEFSLLHDQLINRVLDYYSVYLPEDAIELRNCT